MKIYIDTNVLLDWIIGGRPLKQQSEAILSAAKSKAFKLLVAFLLENKLMEDYRRL